MSNRAIFKDRKWYLKIKNRYLNKYLLQLKKYYNLKYSEINLYKLQLIGLFQQNVSNRQKLIEPNST